MTAVVALIVTYNAEEQIGTCLEALSALDLAEIRVLDNASSDSTVATVERMASESDRVGPPVRCVTSPVNRGFGAGVNLAAAGVDAEALLLVNPDCVLPPETFERMIAYLISHPEVSAVGPGMTDSVGSRQISGGHRPTLLKETLAFLHLDALVSTRLRRTIGSIAARRRNHGTLMSYLASLADAGPVPLEWLSGFCLLIRASAWASAGGFDPSFFMYYEDVDLCLRLQRLGGAVVCLTDVTAVHLGSASAEKVGKSRLLIGGMTSYFEKHGSSLERRLARVLSRAA